ncbi:hypoxanthine phosphoribosyltransferase [Defluviitalea phaphyphila]|uniref:hypoxanthine phosphoribosyltransferase n=1 Tax=Defluviitalea phaphyphila TaxID=1473580 RepID=UPI000A7919F5|nr:hypoxanthine phosphoribosyltransferase [Defluviitalea phaphyphila]
MKSDIKEILFTEEELLKKVEELGKKITKDYEGEELTVIGILKGSNIFMGDLIRKIDIPVYIDFMVVSSYGQSTESSGVVKVLKDLEHSIEGKNVLIVEDIIDTGLTLDYLKSNLLRRKPKSLKICTLLDKPARRKIDLKIDYKGFEIPDEFIVGYGIDYAEKYRNLPYVAVLKEEAYK